MTKKKLEEQNREMTEKEQEEIRSREEAHKYAENVQEKRDSDIMGTAPVKGLLIKMALPLMISMFVQSLYNVVDSIFVSRISEDALTAVTLVFPIQMLNAAFGIGTAVGMSALLSRYLGAKSYAKADKVVHNGFVLAIINYAIFVALSFFSEAFITAQTSDPTIVEYGTVYMRITQLLSIAPMMQSMLERLLQGTGKTKYILYVQVSGALVNIAMDPIFIFGYFGVPAMGVKGAAIATVFGQLVAVGIGYYLNTRKNKEIKLSLRKIRPDWQTMKDIYKIGIPSIIMQSVGSVMNFSINQILVSFTPTAVAAFGVYFKLQSFVFMPVFGLNSATVPIVAYNYGAGNRDRLKQCMSLGAKLGIIIMSIGTLLFWLIPRQMMAIFDASPAMTSIGVVALHTISLAFPVAGFCIMRGAVFQALGKSVYSMYTSLIRQLVGIIPIAYFLAQTGSLDLVWMAFPIAEVLGLITTIICSKTIKRKMIDRM